MTIKANERFQRHIQLIESALNSLPVVKANAGRELLKAMVIGADDLDSMLDPISKDMIPHAGAVILKREVFHRKCKDMGEWLKANCPDVVLD